MDDLDRAIDMTARLVSFDTESDKSNLPLIDFVESYLRAEGVPFARAPNAIGDKAAIMATIGPMTSGGVVLSGHTDVVPVEGQDWSSDPFTVRRDGGRLYGRGTVDMKGFGAVALASNTENGPTIEGIENPGTGREKLKPNAFKLFVSRRSVTAASRFGRNADRASVTRSCACDMDSCASATRALPSGAKPISTARFKLSGNGVCAEAAAAATNTKKIADLRILMCLRKIRGVGRIHRPARRRCRGRTKSCR